MPVASVSGTGHSAHSLRSAMPARRTGAAVPCGPARGTPVGRMGAWRREGEEGLRVLLWSLLS